MISSRLACDSSARRVRNDDYSSLNKADTKQVIGKPLSLFRTEFGVSELSQLRYLMLPSLFR